MYDNKTDLKGLYRQWPTERLVKAVANESGDYKSEAIEAMRTVLVERGATEADLTAASAAAAAMPIWAKFDRAFREEKAALFRSRFGAALVDAILSYLFLMAADFFLGEDWYGRTLWFWLIVFAAYYIVGEAQFGATPGKRLVSLRVVMLDGKPCGYGRAAIRFALRIIECFAAPIVALVAFFSSKKCQRLGDMAAGTLVVWAKDLN